MSEPDSYFCSTNSVVKKNKPEITTQRLLVFLLLPIAQIDLIAGLEDCGFIASLNKCSFKGFTK